MSQGKGQHVAQGGTDGPGLRGRHHHPGRVDDAAPDLGDTDRLREVADGPDTLAEHPGRIRVVVLGAAELGRELVLAFQRLGAEVIVIDRDADAPLRGVADRSVVAKLTATDELTATLGALRPDYLVTATGAVAVDALTAAAESGRTQVVPSPNAARLAANREGLRRLAADEIGLPTAPFWFAGSIDELRAVAEHAGFPMLVKPVAAPAGEGQSLILRPDDVEPAWQRAVSAGGRVAHNRVLAETLVEVDYRVMLLTVCGDGPDGPVLDFCAPIGYRRVDGTEDKPVLEAWQPQPMSPVALDAARSIAARIVTALGGRGLFGVELMVKGDEVYFADVTLRPYDHALVTMRTQRLSGFEMQARAVLGLAVDTIMISPGSVRVIHSAREAVDATAAAPKPPKPDAAEALTEALRVPESDVWVFGGHEGRRLGAALATAPDVPTARDRAARTAAALSKLWSS